MKRPGSVPVVLRGGPKDGVVIRVAELNRQLLFPVTSEFDTISMVKAVEGDSTPEMVNVEVAVYERTGDETSLQLPPPAPPDARRIGYEYAYVGMEGK